MAAKKEATATVDVVAVAEISTGDRVVAAGERVSLPVATADALVAQGQATRAAPDPQDYGDGADSAGGDGPAPPAGGPGEAPGAG
jgi:hypothetical protein